MYFESGEMFRYEALLSEQVSRTFCTVNLRVKEVTK